MAGYRLSVLLSEHMGLPQHGSGQQQHGVAVATGPNSFLPSTGARKLWCAFSTPVCPEALDTERAHNQRLRARKVVHKIARCEVVNIPYFMTVLEEKWEIGVQGTKYIVKDLLMSP